MRGSCTICPVGLAAATLFRRGREALEEVDPEVDQHPAPRELHEHDKSGENHAMKTAIPQPALCPQDHALLL